MKFTNAILSVFIALLFLTSCSGGDSVMGNGVSLEVNDPVKVNDPADAEDDVELPQRCSSKPETTSNVPHHQIGVEVVTEVHEELFRRVYSLPGVENRASVIGNWRGLWLSEQVTIAEPDAIISEREFGHIHDDGSLHIFLEASRADETVTACWGVLHPFAVQEIAGWDGFVLLYTPQSMNELNVTFQLVVDGYNYVTGQNLLSTDYY